MHILLQNFQLIYAKDYCMTIVLFRRDSGHLEDFFSCYYIPHRAKYIYGIFIIFIIFKATKTHTGRMIRMSRSLIQIRPLKHSHV